MIWNGVDLLLNKPTNILSRFMNFIMNFASHGVLGFWGFVVLDPFYAWLITFYSKFGPINLLNYKHLSYTFITWGRQLFNYFNMIVHIKPSFSFISWIFLSLWSISPSSLGHYLSTIKILSDRLILGIIPWNIFMSVIIIHSSWCYIIRLSCTLYFMNI